MCELIYRKPCIISYLEHLRSPLLGAIRLVAYVFTFPLTLVCLSASLKFLSSYSVPFPFILGVF